MKLEQSMQSKLYELSVILSLVALTAKEPCAGALRPTPAPRNSVRIVYWAGGRKVPVDFLAKAKKLGYNYLLYEMSVADYGWPDGLRSRLSSAFHEADAYGLRLIPLFQTGGIHAGHWRKISPLEMQRIPSTLCTGSEPLIVSCSESNNHVPLFAPDSIQQNGFDRSFEQLINIIYQSFYTVVSDVHNPLSYSNLEYIHIGFDEPVHRWKDNPHDYLLMAGLCSADKHWIQKSCQSSSMNSCILSLIADNLARKIDVIKKIASEHSCSTKVIIYADILDPNHLGGYDRLFTLNDFDTPTKLKNIKTWRLIDREKLQRRKSHLVLMQWLYNHHYNQKDYNTQATFDLFSSRGYAMLYSCALADGDEKISLSRAHQIKEVTELSQKPKYKRHILGYAAMHFSPHLWNANPAHVPLPQFLTMEVIPALLQGDYRLLNEALTKELQ